jgi:hypothetical protein
MNGHPSIIHKDNLPAIIYFFIFFAYVNYQRKMITPICEQLFFTREQFMTGLALHICMVGALLFLLMQTL